MGRMIKLLDDIIIDPNDPQNEGVIFASKIHFEINKIVARQDPYWLTDLSSNISALSEAVHGGLELDHKVRSNIAVRLWRILNNLVQMGRSLKGL